MTVFLRSTTLFIWLNINCSSSHNLLQVTGKTSHLVQYGPQDQMEAGVRRWWLTAASEQERKLSCGTDELVTGSIRT